MEREPDLLMVVLGVTIVGALVLGGAARRIGAPAVTGQLLGGLAIGALMLPRMDAETVALLEIGMHAIACYVLFGLGSLLSVRAFRAELRAVIILAGAALGIGVSLVALVLLLPLPLELGFVPAAPGAWREVVLVALVVITGSPTLVAYVSRDEESDGSFARAALGAALLLNAFVVVASAMWWPWSTQRDGAGGAGILVADLALGLAAGSMFGLSCARLRFRPALALGLGLALGLVVWELTRESWLPIMAAALSAGVASANAGARETPASVGAAPLRHASPALFALVAALTDVRLVTDFLVPALVLVVVRAIAFLLAARVAGRLAGNLEIGRLGAASLLPQAGFAALLAATLVEPHEAWRGLLVAVVLVNLVLTPPLLKGALRAAEAATPTTPAPEGLAS